MAFEFHLPDIGEGLTEAVVVRWWVEVGQPVDMDAPLVEIETDKAIVDIPSPYAGILLHQGAAPGETVPVEALLAVVGEPDETWQAGSHAPLGSSVQEPGEPPRPAEAAPIVGRLEEAESFTPAMRRPIEALPMVRRLASQLGVDLGAVAGTGPAGRITEEDVRRAAAGTGGPVRRVRLSPVRRVIADNLSKSWREIPHVTTYGEADAAGVLRERERSGRPPLEAVLIHRLVPVLVSFPEFNATLAEGELVERLFYDLGFAVDTPDGLMVAVVRGADAMTVDELSSEVHRLSSAARERTARPDELRGQTFTLSNIGAVGGRYGTPIVPYGTTAILSIGRADPRPVVRNGEIAIATEFPLSLSYDHRAIDGARGRAFLAAVVEALEA